MESDTEIGEAVERRIQDFPRMRLGDLKWVKWVLGREQNSDKTRKLTQAEIDDLADVEMKITPTEPTIWTAVDWRPESKFGTLIAVVDTDASANGAEHVATGRCNELSPLVGIECGAYYGQQQYIAANTGECGPGCDPDHVTTVVVLQRIGASETPPKTVVPAAKLVCRHTRQFCRNQCQGSVAGRVGALEQLLVDCRSLLYVMPPDWPNRALLQMAVEKVLKAQVMQ